MSDLIERQDAIDVLELLADKMSDEGQTVMAQAVAVLKDLQSAEPERKKGRWELFGMIYYCSECGHDYDQGGNNFCGNCGADMRGE